jgi:hypothetical protein
LIESAPNDLVSDGDHGANRDLASVARAPRFVEGRIHQ